MLNNVTIVGRLTRDPELRSTASGSSVASFTIANDNGMQNGVKQTVFINVSAFGKQADFVAKFFRKGNLIGIVGRLTQRKYVNRNNVEVTTTEINADRIDFVDSKSDREGQAAGPRAPEEPISQVNPSEESKNLDALDIVDDDLPF